MTVKEYAEYLLSFTEDHNKHYASEAIPYDTDFTALSIYHHPLICHVRVMQQEDDQQDMFSVSTPNNDNTTKEIKHG